MAKKSSIVKYNKSLKLIEQYRERHKELKEIVRNPNTSDEDREIAQIKLGKIPKRALPVRLVTRCQVTGRTRGVYNRFKLSRIKFRELAHEGKLPGVAKASW